MKKLLALLFALLAAPAGAQVIPSGPVGALNYWGVGGLSQVLNPGLAGQCLTTQGTGSAPVWVNCQVSSLSLLPPINTNQFYGNVSGQFAPPVGVDVNTILNTVGYDIARPPPVESIIYKSNVGPLFNWQALFPGTAGSLLTSGGPTNPPFWATNQIQANLSGICTTIGAVLYFDTPSLQWKCLSPGTSGQVLQTGGAGANPSYLTLSGTAPITYSAGVIGVTASALTSANDTNVTVALGGTPSTALLQPASITMGWTGVLALGRGGTGASTQQGALNNIAPTPTRAGDIIFWNGSNWVDLAGNNSGTQVLQETSAGVPSWSNVGVTLTAPQGRLTLVANTPVMTSSATAQTTLRYDCYIGGIVPYFTGAVDTLDTISSCEVTDALVAAASAGQVVANNVYDVWWEGNTNHNICLAMSASSGGGGGWSSDTGGSNTARGTGYTQLDRTTRPYITNKNAIANCFNGSTNYGSIVANRLTYLGTVYASANGQISYTFGASASGGTAALFGVWNMYNRVNVGANVVDSGTSYTYSSATVRQARASAGNQIAFVLGLAEDSVIASYSAILEPVNVVNATTKIGLGFDSTSAFAQQPSQSFNNTTASGLINAGTNAGVWAAGPGFHTLSANEASDGANANTYDNSGLNTLAAQLRM